MQIKRKLWPPKAKSQALPLSPAEIQHRIQHEWDFSYHMVISETAFSSPSYNPRNFVETIPLRPKWCSQFSLSVIAYLCQSE